MTAILLAPHNDDETLFASFLILRYRPKVIVCLRSERMHRADYPGGPLEVPPVRRTGETVLALNALYQFAPQTVLLEEDGYLESWPISDHFVHEADLYDRIGKAVAAADLVIYPAWEHGGNEQHNMVAQFAEAELLATDKPRIAYLTYTANGRSHDGEEVPFEPDWPARKLRALACYGSQIEHPATAAHFLDGGLREYVA